MDVRKMRNEVLGKRVVAALESRNMEAYYVETKEEAVQKALELIPKGSSINMGGASSVKECGCCSPFLFVQIKVTEPQMNCSEKAYSRAETGTACC